MKTKKSLSVFQIAAVYIGTIVGAGFASGQELLQFFGYFGIWGIAGLLLATALFALFGAQLMLIGNRLQADSYKAVLEALGGRWLGLLLNVVITFFLFGLLVAMVAGVGATFLQEFRLPESWGLALMAFLAGATVFSGFGKVVDATTAVVPLLILATLVIGICLLLNFPVKLLWSSPQSAPIPNWVLSSLVYVSYNLTLAISVLAPMGAMAERKKIKRGALLGSAGLGACALVILFAILIRAPFAADAEIPMLLIAGELSAGARVLYTVVLLLEVYTTAIGSLFGFISRLVPTANPWYKPLTVLTALAAFFAARLGFSCIVATVYPLVGLFGLLLLVILVFDLYKGLK